MLSLLTEIRFWSTQDDINLKPTDYSAFKYNTKKEATEHIHASCKQTYAEQRGLTYILLNKRPDKLRDKLKELEDHLLTNRVICKSWTENHLQLVLSKGLIVTLKINKNSSDIISIRFNKQLISKLQNEVLCDGVISGNQIICICKDGRVFGCGSKDWVIESGSRRNLSLEGELLAIWGRTGAEHPQPWSPLAKDHQRANLLLYWIGARGPDLLSYKKTEGEPFAVVVSKIHVKTIIVVEQKVSQRGAVSVEVCLFELITNNLKRSSITSVPLQTQISCCEMSQNETFLMLGCIDGSLALLDRNRGSTKIIKASFIPTHITWHKSEVIAAISNERGQIQYYDTALNCVKTQLISDDSSLNTIDISSYFNTQQTVASLHWGPKDLLVALEQGPLIILSHNEHGLHFISLVQIYLQNSQFEKAIRLLLSWEFNEQAFSALQRIVARIMRVPLTENMAKLLQDALGSFHCPSIPLSDRVRHKFSAQVKSLTRRFFHQLVRTKMFETAFLLAVDLGHHDLFMDLHYIAVEIGETEMAAAARAQASALLSRCSSAASNCSRSSCSQCSETSSSGTSEDSAPTSPIPPQDIKRFTSTPYQSSYNDNCLTTNFNNLTPKTYKSTYVPPIPNIDLPKINYTKLYKQSIPSVHKIGNTPPLPIAPPLPITPSLANSQLGIPQLGLPQLDLPQLGIPQLSTPPMFNTSRTFTRNHYNSNNFNLNHNFLNENRFSFMPIRSIPPPLPVAPPLVPVIPSLATPLIPVPAPLHNPAIQNVPNAAQNNQPAQAKKGQAKVKFSDTVTAFIVPEVKRPIRVPPPAHVTDPQKELADSLPLCHPNEDYLKDFTPVRRSETNETPAQPKIKVVHFGVV